MSAFRAVRRVSEVAPEGVSMSAALTPLHQLLHLQLMRKALADADVAIARSLLEQAQLSLQHIREELAERTTSMRAQRRQAAKKCMAQPAEVQALRRWREHELQLLSGIDQHQAELRDQEERTAQVRVDLSDRLRRQRLITLRGEKIHAIIDELEDC
jgi:hypothetical protein